MGGGRPRPRDRLRAPDARHRAGPAPLTRARAAASIAAAVLPSLAATLAFATAPDAARRLFRADAAGLVLLVAVAAFTEGSVRRRTLLLAAACALSAAVHVAFALAASVPAQGAASLAVISAGVAWAGAGLASLGRRLCPPVAAGAVAAAVLWTAALGVWWVDDVAETLPLDRRALLRRAVLRLDFVTAAAYDAAAFDRLRSPEVYERTTIGTLALEAPTALDTAGWWAAVGAAAGAAALALRRPAPRTTLAA